MDKIQKQLEAFAHIGNNWDSYGAVPTSMEIIARVDVYLRKILTKGITKPYLIPTVSGGIQLEWRNGPMFLEIEFHVNVESVTVFYGNDTHNGETWVEKTFFLEDPGLFKLLEWISE